MALRPHRPAQTGLSRLLFETNPRPVRSLALGRRLAPASSPCSCPWACHSSIRLPGAAAGASCVTSMPRVSVWVASPWGVFSAPHAARCAPCYRTLAGAPARCDRKWPAMPWGRHPAASVWHCARSSPISPLWRASVWWVRWATSARCTCCPDVACRCLSRSSPMRSPVPGAPSRSICPPWSVATCSGLWAIRPRPVQPR